MYNLLKQTLILAIVSLLAFFNIVLFHESLIGWVIFVVYLLMTASYSFWILVKFFIFPEKLWRVRVLAVFLSLGGLGLTAAPFILFGRLTGPIIALVFFLNGLVQLFLGHWAKVSKRAPAPEIAEKDFYLEEGSSGPIGVLIYLGLAVFAFYLLRQNVADGNINTPWQIINGSYVYVFALATLILGFLIFSRLQGKTILFLLVAHSFLLHSYLPMTHRLIYGADQWRHMAVEQQIAREERISPPAYDAGTFLHALNPGKFSYSQLWGLTAILSRLLNMPLLTLNVWLAPVFWSVLLPIILFEFAFALGWKKKESLLFVFLGFLPFAWQAGGAFTLPVNLGFLFWLLSMLLLLKRLKEKRPGQGIMLFLYGLALAGGYILYFILFWLAWGTAELMNLKIGKIKRTFTLLGALIIMPFVLPSIELITKYSEWSKNINWLGQLKQLAGNFTAFYLASGPRPHDIATGNVIFNQMPAYAFAPNFFTEWRWWIAGVAIVLLLLMTAGFISALRNSEAKWRWLAVLTFGIFGSYAISRYFLAGENILTRRLDAVLAFLILIMAFYTLQKLFRAEKFLVKIYLRRWLLILTIIVCSISITTSYSLGPDTWAVSVDEYEAMKYVWNEEAGASKSCVVAGTYPLLVLEAVSAKRIVGGGFPGNEYFAQPELGGIYNELRRKIDPEAWTRALNLTGAEHCWLVVDRKSAGADKVFGEVSVLKYQK